MKNNYLFLAVLIIFTAVSCKKNPLKPVTNLPSCSGPPDIVSQNSFPSTMANQDELTQQVQIARDANGNIYTVGPYTGTISLGSFTLSGGSFFLKKNDPTGKILYAKNINLPVSPDYNVNADSLQNVYLCYLSLNLPYNIVINLNKYDSQGNLSWTKQIPFNMDVYLPYVTVSNSGKIFMSLNNFSNPIDSIYLAGYGNLLYVFDTNGNLTAKKNINSNIYAQAQVIYSGNLYALQYSSFTQGTTISKLADDGTKLSTKILNHSYDQNLYIDRKLNMYLFDTVSIKKIDTSLRTIWQVNTPVFNEFNTDDYGNVYVAGVFTGTKNFDVSSGTYNMTAKGSTDNYMEKIDASGKFAWAIQNLGNADKKHPLSSINSYVINQQGYIYVTGYAVNTGTGNTDIFTTAYKQCTNKQ